MTEEEFRDRLIARAPVMIVFTEESPLFVPKAIADEARRMVGYLPAFLAEVKPLPTGDVKANMFIRS